MAGPRRQQPPPLEAKHFKPDEIERAISKLKKRIADVKALDPHGVQHGDQRIANVEQSIRTTILEIYGPNSPEYREHEHHTIFHGAITIGGGGGQLQRGFAAGIPQTNMMLEGLVRGLEEQRAEIAEDPSLKIRGAFRGLELHPTIASAAAKLAFLVGVAQHRRCEDHWLKVPPALFEK